MASNARVEHLTTKSTKAGHSLRFALFRSLGASSGIRVLRFESHGPLDAVPLYIEIVHKRRSPTSEVIECIE